MVSRVEKLKQLGARTSKRLPAAFSDADSGDVDSSDTDSGVEND